MTRYFWTTAVALLALILTAAACSTAAPEAELTAISGPAFILFYTDN